MLLHHLSLHPRLALAFRTSFYTSRLGFMEQNFLSTAEIHRGIYYELFVT